MQLLKNKITDIKKEKIIKFKTSLLTEEGRTPKFSSYNIYQAILNKNLMKDNDIKDYLIKNGIDFYY